MFRVLSACVLAWAGLAAAGHAQTADNGFNLSAGYSRIDLENFDLGAVPGILSRRVCRRTCAPH